MLGHKRVLVARSDAGFKSSFKGDRAIRRNC